MGKVIPDRRPRVGIRVYLCGHYGHRDISTAFLGYDAALKVAHQIGTEGFHIIDGDSAEFFPPHMVARISVEPAS